ncbi:riboflavin biosynthesis protein RibF [bacterium]|nr:riboflavin biosynthesis protein RibF [bacterium]
MKIINELVEIPNLSLALGFFDGMHLGHQSVINCAVDFARQTSTKSAVVTFKEHPLCYLKGLPPKYIIPREEVYNIMGEIGVDYIIELDFALVSQMNPIEYLRDVLYKYFSPKAISTGFNHHFGSSKTGNVKFLSDCQSRFNYTYFATPAESLYGDIISSTAIRSFIHSGIINIANDMLGRKFAVSGMVIPGKKLGKKFGYPTANISYPENIIEPKSGVYKVRVTLPDGKKYLAVANYGNNPTVNNNETNTFEVHIPNFSGDLYWKNLKVEFIKMIRSEFKFSSVEELKEQIQKDIDSIM